MSRAIFKMRGVLSVRLPIEIVGSVLGNVSSTPGQNHSLGSMDVGASNPIKNIILGLTWGSEFSQIASQGITVGGVFLTRVDQIVNSVTTMTGSAIYIGDISSLSGSQNIVAAFLSAAIDSAAVSGVAVTGPESLQETMKVLIAEDSGANPVLADLESELGGIVFAVSAGSNRNAGASWSSVTERVDVQTGNGAQAEDHRHTAAWDLGEHTAADETITYTTSTKRTAMGAGLR